MSGGQMQGEGEGEIIILPPAVVQKNPGPPLWFLNLKNKMS